MACSYTTNSMAPYEWYATVYVYVSLCTWLLINKLLNCECIMLVTFKLYVLYIFLVLAKVASGS